MYKFRIISNGSEYKTQYKWEGPLWSYFWPLFPSYNRPNYWRYLGGVDKTIEEARERIKNTKDEINMEYKVVESD